MTSFSKWASLRCKLIAILRGIEPEETPGVVEALLEAGFEAIEIPLNSPQALRSVEIASRLAGAHGLIGAGTVLRQEEVVQLAGAGAGLAVSPNVDVHVIQKAQELGMMVIPGVFTPSEALLATANGALVLKFFPASVLGPEGMKAIKAVLPAAVEPCAVGGVSQADFASYACCGIHAFGLGGSLYQPGARPATVKKRAQAAIAAYNQALAELGHV